MIFVAFAAAGLLATALFLWALDRRDLANEYRKMNSMTPEEAHRHAMTLKYLPQSELEMRLLDDAINRGGLK